MGLRDALFGIFGRKKRAKERIIVLNCGKIENRVALLNKGRLEEYQIERKGEESIAGAVFVGRVDSISKSLDAVFVDIGRGKNGFLHFKDMLPATYEMIESSIEGSTNLAENKSGGRKQSRLQKKYGLGFRGKGRIDLNDIPKLFPVGSEIIVQVVKDSIGGKGPKLTTNISIPGRYVVLLPFSDVRGVSKKIEDEEERRRLHRIIRSLELPEGMGCICRTNGEGRREEYFRNDLKILLEIWDKNVLSKRGEQEVPRLIYKEPDLVERTIRDSLTEEIDEVVIDDTQTYQYARELVARVVGGNFLNKIVLYRSPKNIFDYYGVEKQVEEIFARRVNLKGGGWISIDETEALIAIDVNSGTVKGKDHPETILKVNIEAAEEIARQLRLRNMGGLVVIDFIDMKDSKDRDMVYQVMKRAVENDRAKTRILPISRFGLMEMTRQRESESLVDATYDDCPYCAGKGVVKSATTIRAEIQRALIEIFKKYKKERKLSVRVYVHPQILASIKNEDEGVLNEFEKEYGRDISFRADTALHIEKFRIVDQDTEEILV